MSAVDRRFPIFSHAEFRRSARSGDGARAECDLLRIQFRHGRARAAAARVGIIASPSLFTTLGVQAAIGRIFAADEAELGHERVVLLSHTLWRDQFGADSSVVGRDVRISGQPHHVVGVMPASFVFPRSEIALWVPFAFSERQKSDSMRGTEFAQAIGRLAPGATIEQLKAQLDAIVAHNSDRMPPEFKARVADTGFAGRARPLRKQLAGDVRSTRWLLQAAVALVLLIACANVANLK